MLNEVVELKPISNGKRNSDILYRKQHWFAIRLKNRIYKRLPHVRKKARESNRRRKDCYKKWYEKNRERLIRKAKLWAEENRERKRQHQRKYKEKLRLRQKRQNMKSKVERVIKEFLDYCGQRYDKETTRHYKINIGRFYNYIVSHKTKCPEYHRRHYQEMQKPEGMRDPGWTKEFRRIQCTEEMDRGFITRYVSFVNHDEINKETNQPLAQPQKEARLYPLKSFLWFCLRKGYIRNDLRKYIIVPPREKKILKRVLTQDEMAKFLDSTDITTALGVRDKALLELCYSGLRSEEILSLKIGHLDLDTNTVTILGAKGDKDRVIPMTSEALYWIKKWFYKRQSLIKGRVDGEYVFISKNARPINRRNFSTMVKNYAKKAAIDLDVSPHDLRRTTATHLVENGASIRLIQALLGHATLGVTTKYLRLSEEKIKKEHKDTHPSNRRNLYYGDIQAEVHGTVS